MTIFDSTVRDGTRADPATEPLTVSETLADCLAIGIIAVSATKKISAFNADAESMTGLTALQVVGESLDSLPAPLRTILQQTFEKRRPFVDQQILLKLETATELLIQARTLLYQDEQGEITAVLLILQNVSPAKNLELKLRRLDRLAKSGILAASASHELKNALVAIKTFIDLLLERNQDSELSGIVKREIKRIDSIISQLLKFAGPPSPNFAAIHLHEVLDTSLRLVQHQLASHQVKLSRSFKASNDLVKGDETQLRQALINLFLNAIEATAGGGNLRISTELSSAPDPGKGSHPQIQLSIADTGSGISPGDIAHLYEPFFTTKPEGTGLGLAITRRIFEEHNGTITVESEPNKGTIFKILLPLLTNAA
jgi:PAS domain S-box-containing protein